MVNKRYLLLAGMLTALAGQPAVAQESGSTSGASWSGRDMTYRGVNYDVLDSNYYSEKNLEQFSRYQAHQTAFPPKPRNMWELGLSVGSMNIFGDIPTKTIFNAAPGGTPYAFGLSLRKALGYTFSLRLQANYGKAHGFNHEPSLGQADQLNAYRPGGPGDKAGEAALIAAGVPAQFQSAYSGRSFYNYRTTIFDFGLHVMAATNNISFHKDRNSVSFYGFGGIAYTTVDVDRNSRDEGNPGANNYYTFQSDIYNMLSQAGQNLQTTAPDFRYFNDADNQDDINDYLNDVFDDSYESPYLNNRGEFVPQVGGGIQFRLGKRVSLGLEEKLTFFLNDEADGFFKQDNGSLTPNHDVLAHTSLTLGFNLGNSSRRVAPLWWVNPLDHAYSELSDPRHMRLPDPILSDDDNDGVSNQFDKCPGTPENTMVDSHGCPMDTDKDGVPDYMDKQIITPTECQPVDADGVGKCPCPDGCGGGTGVAACGNINSGVLSFSGSNTRISNNIGSQLNNLAAQMQANTTCRVVIAGMGNGGKAQQQRSWDRVNAVIEYMSEKHNIDRRRFIFQYSAAGDENSVMYRSANVGEEGPSNVPPPFPNLRRD